MNARGRSEGGENRWLDVRGLPGKGRESRTGLFGQDGKKRPRCFSGAARTVL